jgi:nucleoside 2-deoxyribosyltransferase
MTRTTTQRTQPLPGPTRNARHIYYLGRWSWKLLLDNGVHNGYNIGIGDTEMTKIFLACPVRGITDEYREGIETQVKWLENHGFTVHYPPRDTNQDDISGLRICKDNRQAIEEADSVYVIWDGKSQGVLFDIGMAFALRKPIHPITGYVPAVDNYKSFQKMMWDWEENGAQ